MVIEVPESRIDALVRLLGDDDQKIFTVAWDELERIGEPALPFLARASQTATDPRVRVQSGRFLKEWSRREVFRRWTQFCRGKDLDLEEGAFLIAETEYPDVDMVPYRHRLDEFARVLRQRLLTARTTDDAVRRISALLFGEVGFKGNAGDYYNADNSYLNRVLDQKKGIPITLAVIYLLVARRLLVPVHGVGAPHRFLLKYRGTGREAFIDVFHGGRLLGAGECARFISEAGVSFEEDHLRAVPDKAILVRMLANLVRLYATSGDHRRRDRVSVMLKILA